MLLLTLVDRLGPKLVRTRCEHTHTADEANERSNWLLLLLLLRDLSIVHPLNVLLLF